LPLQRRSHGGSDIEKREKAWSLGIRCGHYREGEAGKHGCARTPSEVAKNPPDGRRQIALRADDRPLAPRHAAQTMTNDHTPAEKESLRSKERDLPPARPPRRFARTDGRFDLPVVTGRTPQEVARRLA
jgi:hypothetical protein